MEGAEEVALQGVYAPQPINEDEFIDVPLSETIEEILEEIDHGQGQLQFLCRFDDDHRNIVGFYSTVP